MDQHKAKIVMDMQSIAHKNMVNRQIRSWDVLNPSILQLMRSLPRAEFIPKPYQSLAYADYPTPIGDGQVTMTPREEGRILQALNLSPTHTLLEIGTGCGYLTALLAQRVNRVYTVEIRPHLLQHAQQCIQRHNIDNVTFLEGNAYQGWAEYAPYDTIVVTGSMPYLPKSLSEQLNVNGEIFAVIGSQTPMMPAKWLQRTDEGWISQNIYETYVPPLDGIPETNNFQF